MPPDRKADGPEQASSQRSCAFLAVPLRPAAQLQPLCLGELARTTRFRRIRPIPPDDFGPLVHSAPVLKVRSHQGWPASGGFRRQLNETDILLGGDCASQKPPAPRALL